MDHTMSEVLQFVRENDVKFIRLAFCDIFGMQKNVSIMPHELERAFESGISFDASAIRGFMNVEESDLFLVPDPATLSILPWRPSQGSVVRFFCSVRRPDGRPFEGDMRFLLRESVRRAAGQGYSCKAGPECEFYLFQADEEGRPSFLPHDRGGYFDIAPLDRGENVRRDICLSLMEMGILPESSHHEQGPGQNEIDFRYADILTAADNLVAFRAVVKAIAARSGLYASFMPKPFEEESGSGLHVNLSLHENGVNLFRGGEAPSGKAEGFTAGILRRVPEMTAFLNPLTNSYRRFGAFEAPRFVSWSRQNRSQLVRIPAACGPYGRMELRSPDPACNPYLCFMLLLEAGLEGVKEELRLPGEASFDLYSETGRAAGLPELPKSLEEALERAGESAFIRRLLPERTLESYLAEKRQECRAAEKAPDRLHFEREFYFERI